jgi:hypothetical protein
MATGVFEYFYPPRVISGFFTITKGRWYTVYEILLVFLLLFNLVCSKKERTTFFSYIRIKFLLIEIEAKCKEKSAPSAKDKH